MEARRALQIDPQLAEADVALVFASFLYRWDWKGAEAGFQRVIAANPQYPPAHQWYGVYLSAAGRHEMAIAELRRAIELDPPSLVLNSVLGWILYSARRYDEAIAQCQTTLRMDSTYPLAYLYLAEAWTEKGDTAAAVDAFRRAGATPGGSPRVLSELAHALGAGGRRTQAEQLANALEERARREYFDAYSLALIRLGLGDYDSAITLLEKAEQERFPWLVRLKVEARFDPLRDNPRFRALVERVGIP
jgi:tetratricopeptide (TPR) repeat protein